MDLPKAGGPAEVAVDGVCLMGGRGVSAVTMLLPGALTPSIWGLTWLLGALGTSGMTGTGGLEVSTNVMMFRPATPAPWP